MPFPWLAAAAGLNMVMGAASNERNRKDANRKDDREAADKKAIYDRAFGIFDKFMQNYDQANQSGFFDASSRIKGMQEEVAPYEKASMESMGGAYGAAGGRPGDSRPMHDLAENRFNWRTYTDRMALQIQDNLFTMKQNALSGALQPLAVAQGAAYTAPPPQPQQDLGQGMFALAKGIEDSKSKKKDDS